MHCCWVCGRTRNLPQTPAVCPDCGGRLAMLDLADTVGVAALRRLRQRARTTGRKTKRPAYWWQAAS